MNLTINIDESMFDEVIQKEIKGIPQEQLQQLIKDCIIQRLNSAHKDEDGKFSGINVLESYLFEKNNGYGYYNNNWRATDILTNALKNIDYSEVAEELKNTVLDYIKNHHKEVTMELLWQFMVQGIGNMTWSNHTFLDNLRTAVCQYSPKTNEH